MISKKEVIICISKALKVPAQNIKDNFKSDDCDEWDSLGQLNIMMSLDKKLKGKVVKIKEISEANSLKKIYKILQKNKLLK